MKFNIILDTNIIISGLIGKSIKNILDILGDPNINIYTCQIQLNEINDVFQRKKFRKYFSEDTSNFFINYFNFKAINLKLKSKVSLCRDSKDDYLLSLALDSNSQYLVTGDNDLLDLKTINNCKIITFREFIKISNLEV